MWGRYAESVSWGVVIPATCDRALVWLQQDTTWPRGHSIRSEKVKFTDSGSDDFMLL
jgi:hypothetical protein